MRKLRKNYCYSLLKLTYIENHATVTIYSKTRSVIFFLFVFLLTLERTVSRIKSEH